MFHTLETAITINENMMQRITESTEGWQQQRDRNDNSLPNRIITRHYAYSGISALRIIHTGDEFYRLKVRWNPAVILDGYGAFRTVTADEMREAAELLDDLLWEICPVALPRSICWFPSRIDFSVDLHTYHVDVLTERFSMSRMLPHHRDGLPDNAVGSFYRGCNSVWMNFYKKQAELIYKGASEAAIQAAANILRIEIQSSRANLRSVSDRFTIGNNQILNEFLSDDLAWQVVLNYYQRTIGLEDFFSIGRAAMRLAGRRVKPKDIAKLRDTLRAVEAAGGLTEAREQACDGIFLPNGSVYRCCKGTFDKRVCDLRSNGINPIPLHGSYGCTLVPNPMSEYMVQNGLHVLNRAS